MTTERTTTSDLTLSTDEAEDIYYEAVAVQTVSEHRWYTKQLVVFEHDGQLRGFYYLDPATEMQEGQDRFESDPVQTFPVTAREVVVTRYEVTA
jgi:hypothetical protein